MRVGIVLGAGGPVGWAYHLGVIEGVRDAIGREPAKADRIVGVSAGAPIAAGVLGGSSTTEILDVITTPPSGEDRDSLRAAGRRALRNPVQLLRPMAPNLVRNIGHVGASTAAVGLLPAGVFPTGPLRRLISDPGQPWPDALWIPSVRIDDGQVVVFGRDRVDVSVADAIEATSAVPGVFQPKVIDGSRYVDGAVASATHANILLPHEPSVVLISSPMTRPGRGPIRVRARRQLAAEAQALRNGGARTIVLTPTEAVLEAADGFPRGRPDAGKDIVAAARLQTIEAFAEHRRHRSSPNQPAG